MTDKLNQAYSERNCAVILAVKLALLQGLNAGKGKDGNTDWEDEWRNVVYIDLPNGKQVSWHIAPSEVHLLKDIPEYKGKWDGTYLSKGEEFLPMKPKLNRYLITYVEGEEKVQEIVEAENKEQIIDNTEDFHRWNYIYELKYNAKDNQNPYEGN